jgi:hypothetical protein
MVKPKNMKKFLILTIGIFALITSCKKETDAHIPPDLAFKTGGNYTAGDATVTAGDSILVGIIVTKKEDDLRTFNISYAYDGASSTTTFYNYTMTTAEYTGYDHDFWITTRSTPGTERWVFTVTDRDGNLAQRTINLTVQ